MAEPIATVNAEDTVRDETVLHQLGRTETYWTWKAAIRVALCVLEIVAIGCAGWLLAHPTRLSSNPYAYYFDWIDSAVGGIIVLAVSFVWCLIWVVLPLLLKPPRALHPGIAVGFDLIFWLAFIVVGLFGVVGVIGWQQFGLDGTLSDPNDGYTGYGNSGINYSGDYYLAPNNTWVYEITRPPIDPDSYHYNYTTGQQEYNYTDPSTVVRQCSPTFDTCKQQDEFINRLWREKPKRFAFEVIINVVEWLGVVMHFALFVWACVDTHRYNRARYGNKEKTVADRIIADLESRGLIRVQDGVITHAAPPGQPQIPQSAVLAPETARQYGYINEKDLRSESHGISAA